MAKLQHRSKAHRNRRFLSEHVRTLKSLTLLLFMLRISALPKGLISWFLGRPISERGFSSGSTSRSHQSPAASSFSEYLLPVRGQTPRLVKGEGFSTPTSASTRNEFNLRINHDSWSAKLLVCDPSFNLMSKSMTLTEGINTSSTKRIGQSRLPRFFHRRDFSGQGSSEAFR
jgi:hypothetical protein